MPRGVNVDGPEILPPESECPCMHLIALSFHRRIDQRGKHRGHWGFQRRKQDFFDFVIAIAVLITESLGTMKGNGATTSARRSM